MKHLEQYNYDSVVKEFESQTGIPEIEGLFIIFEDEFNILAPDFELGNPIHVNSPVGLFRRISSNEETKTHIVAIKCGTFWPDGRTKFIEEPSVKLEKISFSHSPIETRHFVEECFQIK